jgi:Anti-sigma factor NepR
VLRGTPDMDVVPTDEKNVRQAIRTGVSDALRNHYGDVLKEAIPNRLTELLEHLNELQRDGPGFSRAGDKK